MISRINTCLFACTIALFLSSCGEEELPQEVTNENEDNSFDGNLTGEETDLNKLSMQMTIGVGNSVPQNFALTPAGVQGNVVLLLPEDGVAPLMIPHTDGDERAFDFFFKNEGLHSFVRKKSQIEAHLDTYFVADASVEIEPNYGLLHDAESFQWTKPTDTSYSFQYAIETAGLQEYYKSLQSTGAIEAQHFTFIFRDSSADNADTLMISIPVEMQF